MALQGKSTDEPARSRPAADALAKLYCSISAPAEPLCGAAPACRRVPYGAEEQGPV